MNGERISLRTPDKTGVFDLVEKHDVLTQTLLWMYSDRPLTSDMERSLKSLRVEIRVPKRAKTVYPKMPVVLLDRIIEAAHHLVMPYAEVRDTRDGQPVVIESQWGAPITVVLRVADSSRSNEIADALEKVLRDVKSLQRPPRGTAMKRKRVADRRPNRMAFLVWCRFGDRVGKQPMGWSAISKRWRDLTDEWSEWLGKGWFFEKDNIRIDDIRE